MSSPADMPQRRPVHTYRPPLEKRSPAPPIRWHCRKKQYPDQEAADAALGEVWSRVTGRQLEAHAYRCRKHGDHEVWHLTKQDQDGQEAVS
ncbi:hypothetical protein Lesp02_70290 [Lentzea sp. NBRC 105346]|uniref:hypothetical protein n=1 Tax=Lentzea sp. NBRC 105346 TaxID=3032205 RepID=UPI0024A02F05|nr:hypothetical protein [Lentzea sp. NBRC 105346]GLZ34842.1 hypothetical protein Lesp02_70290 [Lentzea sp. NBRC 105346]